MKRMIASLIATVAVVVAVGVTATPAQARGYTCAYSKDGITAVLDGYANNRYFCSMFRGAFGAPSSRRPSSRPTCTFRMRAMDVRVRVYTSLGQFACTYLQSAIGKDWRRV